MRLGFQDMFTTPKFYIQVIVLSEKIVKRGAVAFFWESVFKSVREMKHNHDLEIAMAEITTAKDMKIVICS